MAHTGGAANVGYTVRYDDDGDEDDAVLQMLNDVEALHADEGRKSSSLFQHLQQQGGAWQKPLSTCTATNCGAALEPDGSYKLYDSQSSTKTPRPYHRQQQHQQNSKSGNFGSCSSSSSFGSSSSSGGSKMALGSLNHNPVWSKAAMKSRTGTNSTVVVADVDAGPDHSETGRTIPWDRSAVERYLFPASDEYPVREYQRNIVRTALLKNTLVVLPTGLGKTLVAAVVISNYLRWFPTGKVMFLAPTRPLVSQQVEACHKIVGIPSNITARLMGDTKSVNRAKIWQERRLFFCTPQTVQKDLENGLVPAKEFVLIVLDEAHRTTGEFAFTVVLKAILTQTFHCRVLALSATPGKDKASVQTVVDNLGVAAIEHRIETDPDVKKYVFTKTLDVVEVGLSELCKGLKSDLNELAHAQLCDIRKIPGCPSIMRKSAEDLTAEQLQVGLGNTMELGVRFGGPLSALNFCLRLKSQLQTAGAGAMVHMVERARDSATGSKSKKKLIASFEFQRFWKKAHTLVRDPSANPKLCKLSDVLKEHFVRHSAAGQQTSCIVFASLRNTVADIVKHLQEHTDLRVSPFVGQSSSKKGKKKKKGGEDDDEEEKGEGNGDTETVATKGQRQKEQQDIVRRFRAGQLDVLVSTSIGEEGLDIGSVDLIVCFDAIGSPIRMVQRMGRAGRKRSGSVMVLVSEGKEMKDYKRSHKQSNTVVNLLRGGRLMMDRNRSPRMVPLDVNPRCVLTEFSIPIFHGSQVAGSTQEKVRLREDKKRLAEEARSDKRRRRNAGIGGPDGDSDHLGDGLAPLSAKDKEFYMAFVHPRAGPPPPASCVASLPCSRVTALRCMGQRLNKGTMMAPHSQQLRKIFTYIRGKGWEQDGSGRLLAQRNANLAAEEVGILEEESSDNDSEFNLLSLKPASGARNKQPVVARKTSSRDSKATALEVVVVKSSKPSDPVSKTSSKSRVQTIPRNPSPPQMQEQAGNVQANPQTNVVVNEDENSMSMGKNRKSSSSVFNDTNDASKTNKVGSNKQKGNDKKIKSRSKPVELQPSLVRERESLTLSPPFSHRASVDAKVGVVPRFCPGVLVSIAAHTTDGINSLGGNALVECVNQDGSYDVHYVLDNKKELSVEVDFLSPVVDLSAGHPCHIAPAFSTDKAAIATTIDDGGFPSRRAKQHNGKKASARRSTESSSSTIVGSGSSGSSSSSSGSEEEFYLKPRNPKRMQTAKTVVMNPLETSEQSHKIAQKQTEEVMRARKATAYASKVATAQTIVEEGKQGEDQAALESVDDLLLPFEWDDNETESFNGDCVPLPPGARPCPRNWSSFTSFKPYCSICGATDGRGLANSRLLLCMEPRCRTAAHQGCCGISLARVIEDPEQWKCPPCAKALHPGGAVVGGNNCFNNECMCILCPRTDGFLIHLQGRAWAHVSCLRFCVAGQGFRQRQQDGVIEAAEIDGTALAKLHQDVCCCCNKAFGLCATCTLPGCHRKLHASCAVSKHLINEGNIFCPRHVDTVVLEAAEATLGATLAEYKSQQKVQSEQDIPRSVTCSALLPETELTVISKCTNGVGGSTLSPVACNLASQSTATPEVIDDKDSRKGKKSNDAGKNKGENEAKTANRAAPVSSKPVETPLTLRQRSKKSKCRASESDSPLATETDDGKEETPPIARKRKFKGNSDKRPQVQMLSTSESESKPDSDSSSDCEDARSLSASVVALSDSDDGRKLGTALTNEREKKTIMSPNPAYDDNDDDDVSYPVEKIKSKCKIDIRRKGKNSKCHSGCIFVEDEASESSDASHSSDEDENDDDNANLSGLIDDRSQLSIDSKHPLADDDASPLPHGVLHSRHMIESPLQVSSGIAQLLEIERIEQAERRKRRAEKKKFETKKAKKGTCMLIRKNKRAALSTDTSDDDELMDEPTSAAKPKFKKINRVLPSSDDDEEFERKVKKPKHVMASSDEEDKDDENEKAEGSQRLRESTPNQKPVTAALPRADQVTIWADATAVNGLSLSSSSPGGCTVVEQVLVQLDALGSAYVPRLRPCVLQGAHFVLGSRVCALILSQSELVKLWSTMTPVSSGGSGGSSKPSVGGERLLDTLLGDLALRYPVPVVIVQFCPDLDGANDWQCQSEEGSERYEQFFAAMVHTQEAASVQTLLTDSALHSARVIVALAMEERMRGTDLVSLGIAFPIVAKSGPQQQHLLNSERFLTSNPAVSLVTARRLLLLLVENKHPLSHVFNFKPMQLVQNVPGLTTGIAGIALAFFQRRVQNKLAL